VATPAGSHLCTERDQRFDQCFTDPVAAACDHHYFVLEE
jgi:hypothetical protein